jgi:phosphoribosylamine--glycine ligase
VKVLVIGGGGKEHAIVWKLSQSRHVKKIYCCPGNAGIAEIAECIDVSPYDFAALVDFIKYEWIDLTIVNAEEPLLKGVVDSIEKEGCRILGPTKTSAQIGFSRVFAKNLMRHYRIPMPGYKVFTFYPHAEDYVRLKGSPMVIKADGLVRGSGTFLAFTVEEAIDNLRLIMKDRIFGDAVKQVIIEDFLKGKEITFMVFTDGKTLAPLEVSKNYKQLFDGDLGPNTEGMGAYSPVPFIKKDIETVVMDKIMRPLVKALYSEGLRYKGVLSADILMNREGIYVLDLGCTFRDPESQTVLPRLKTDLMEISFAITNERLSDIQNVIEWKNEVSVCVVASSGGYPRIYQKGFIISGLEKVKKMKDIFVFHAGTTYSNGDIVTSEGRVISVSAIGFDIKDARAKVYSAVEKIHFERMHFRRDIGM